MAENRFNYSFIKVLTGSDLSKRRIPFMTIKNANSGPVLWLTACMHGDEIGGTVIIHEVFKQLRKTLIKGTVHAFPLVNPFGFETVSRNISLSKEDLNRSFPGDEKGTLAQRIAAIIFAIISDTKPTLVLDLHNDWNKSIPYVLIDPMENIIQAHLIEEYAIQTGLLRIQDSDTIPSSLTHNLLENGIPALVLELGESYIINEKNIETGINAVWNILQSLGMIKKEKEPFVYALPDQFQNETLTYSSLPLSSSSGILRFLVKPGNLVKKGQKIARICNAFGKITETIYALNNGIVIGLTDTAIAFPGSPVMAFGIN
jgi:uncharacterized protein